MAVSLKPSDWFGAGYSLTTSQIKLNTATHATPSLAEVTDAQANATTGDVRQVSMAILDKLYTTWLALAPADRPAKMTMYRTLGENIDGSPVRTFNFTFILDPAVPQEVIAE